MFQYSIAEKKGVKWAILKGRIDSVTSPRLDECLTSLMDKGARVLVADMEEVNFMSSAGLRMFLKAQKRLKKDGGEIIFYRIADNVRDVLMMTGLFDIYRFCTSEEELEAALLLGKSETSDVHGITVKHIDKWSRPSRLMVLGYKKKDHASLFSEQDVVTIPPAQIRFGGGLATQGVRYDEYRDHFGESAIIDGNFFSSPVTDKTEDAPVLWSGPESHVDYRFLYGFGFKGDWRYVVSFSGKEGIVELDRLADALCEISSAALLGVIILAESEGLRPANLEKAPVDENRLVVGVGLVAAKKEEAAPEIRCLFPTDSRTCMQGVVFSRSPLSRVIGHFASELKRVITEQEVFAVRRLDGRSRFGNGLAAIFELN